MIRFRGTVRFPWALAYAQVFVACVSVFGSVLATIPLFAAAVLAVMAPLALLTVWLAGVLYRPCIDVEADETGLIIGRWRRRRISWRNIGGIVLHGRRTMRLLVVENNGRARVYGCTAQKTPDVEARPLFEFAAERVGMQGAQPADWQDAKFSTVDAFVLAAVIVAPAFAIAIAARGWGAGRWISPSIVYAVVAGLLHLTLSFRLSFAGPLLSRKYSLRAEADRAFAPWRDACKQHRQAKYR